MPEDRADRVPAGIDPTIPTAARIYDYLLGGQDNFAADRAAAHRLAEVSPEIAAVARANRAFLGRTENAAMTGEPLDLSQPVGVVLMAVLQFITDDEGRAGSSPNCSAPCPAAATWCCPTQPATSTPTR